jgi:hypothetical protein
MPVRITKYEQAFELIRVPLNDKAIGILARLEKEGHTEKSICFAVWKEEEKLYQYRRDERFWGIFINSVRKWSWPKGDPRWDEYWKKKNEEKRAKKIQDEIRRQQELKRQANGKRFPGYIYFVQGENGGPIKIGYTKDIAERIRALQTGYPDTLKLLLAIPGNVAKEQLLHLEFKEYRLHGEWFKPVKKVLDKIAELEAKFGTSFPGRTGE